MKVKISGSILTNLFSSVSAGCVGKSSIVLRYCEDKFNSSHLTTLQVCTRHSLQHTKGVRRFLYTSTGREARKLLYSCWSRFYVTVVLQAAFMNKKVKVGERTVNLSIWDTAGQERFHALGPIYYRDAQGR